MSLHLKSLLSRSPVSACFLVVLLASSAQAQVTNTVFSEDFSGPLDTNKFKVGHQSLEGGSGNITPAVANGVVEFTGTVSQQWWAGGDLQIVPTFAANLETNVVVSVDRVAENGSGTAHRSALWIFDSTLTYYVLFAEDVSETDWEYNRKIGKSGDVPTGSGTAISAFDASGSPFRDLGLHNMKAVADGQTVKLYLDDTFGASVPFPFSKLAFEIGSLARANNDIADTTFDNLLVQTVGLEAFAAPTSLTLVSGATISNVVVRIPAGANATQAVHVGVSSDTPAVAIPAGATNGTLVMTFPSAGPNQQSFSVQSVGLGGAIFSLTNDIGMGTANKLSVVVLQPAGVRLSDNFSGATIDTNKWQIDTNAFEVGTGTFTIGQTNNTLVISGTTDTTPYWAGAGLETAKAYTATPQMSLQFDADRVSLDPTSSLGTPDTAARTGMYLITADRSKYVFFGQDWGETGWEVNVSPGNPTGSGTSLPVFGSITDTNTHHLRMVADGSQVEVFLDGQSGGKFPFAVTAGIYCELAAYARAVGDSVTGVFANAEVQGVLPPVSLHVASASQPLTSVETTLGVNTNAVAVTVPLLLGNPLAVTITSQNPQVAIPQGAVNGVLTLSFSPGGTNLETFNVATVGAGTTTFVLTNNQALTTVNGSLGVTVLNPPNMLLSDDFSAGTINTSKWTLDQTPLNPSGTLASDSSAFVTNGTVELFVDVATADWPGMSLFTTTSYTASALSPAIFELDRTKHAYVQVGGNTCKEQTGVWVKDATTNYIFFSDYDTHDGSAGGWQYNSVIGATNDSPVPNVGTVIPSFAPPALNDLGNHHIKVEANGTSVRLFVDGIYGATVPFPFAQGLTFGFGSYANFSNGQGNIVEGYFDNVVISGAGAATPPLGRLTATRQANGQVVISWTGPGTLQSSSSLPGNWTNVSPAPTGNSYTVTPSPNSKLFFQLKQ